MENHDNNQEINLRIIYEDDDEDIIDDIDIRII